ncbi:bifunctional indole-3-glycerol-phosphate synthase TrpC/phosphoribosylanthranilate isomerase TrpF [Utexia brackfieldae]|uniref:bifunctional indole-3-glycerol-phosphate synthase TrpC/phosphoribosylanthranilate isomerase TrpF n=1 Tax=Utexia brackfieldae TaxID=3074108 RepID=UPI00370D9ACD
MAINELSQAVTQSTVLTKIVQDKQIWLTQTKQQRPLATFQAHIIPSDRSFYTALKQPHSVFILECKKASPSKGLIRADFNPTDIANIYQHYAAAISVLTDEKYFQGRFEFITEVRQTVTQPVLCKDFIIDEYQIYLARYYQADAVLLMLSVLNDEQYIHLSQIAHSLNMGVLTEASTEAEVQRAIQLNARVIGINNRNLRDLSVDLARIKQLSPLIPKETIVISESGIYTHQQVLELSQFADGFLIGSALMSEDNIEIAIRRVIFGEHKICGLTRPTDALVSYQAGAVYGGLIFVATSPRAVTVEQAKQVISGAPRLNWVGVFRNEPIESIVSTVKDLSLFAVQLHGDEDKDYIARLHQVLPDHCQIWQAISIEKSVPSYENPLIARYIFDQGNGGTGKTFNWDLLKNQPLNRVILAGGITPDNAIKAIMTGCLGLDINSGVESSPGIKQAEKINQLFTALRSYPYYS